MRHQSADSVVHCGKKSLPGFHTERPDGLRRPPPQGHPAPEVDPGDPPGAGSRPRGRPRSRWAWAHGQSGGHESNAAAHAATTSTTTATTTAAAAATGHDDDLADQPHGHGRRPADAKQRAGTDAAADGHGPAEAANGHATGI